MRSVFAIDKKKACPFCQIEMIMSHNGMAHPKSRKCAFGGVFFGKEHQFYQRWDNRRSVLPEALKRKA